MFPESSGLKFCSETETVSGEVRGVSCVYELSGEDVRTIADIVETTAGIASISLEWNTIISIALNPGTCPLEISNRPSMWLRILEVLADKKIHELVGKGTLN